MTGGLGEIEILPLRLARHSLPDWHPVAPGECEVRAFAIRTPGSVVLVDTGIGKDSAVIDKLYAPRRTDLGTALASHGIDLLDVRAVINSHLHFDHCGNNALFPGVPIFVQRAELEASGAEHYTIPEWVHFAGSNYIQLDGATSVSEQISVVPSPGHTPGHQSVCVESARGRELIVGQAAYTADEFSAASADEFPGLKANSYNDSAYTESLRQLVALAPYRAFFSHDDAIWEEPPGCDPPR